MGSVNLLLEVQVRGQNQYYRLEQSPIRVGRALDNDIIISDPTVSPYHLCIEKTDDGKLILTNFSEENGSRLNLRPLKQETVDLHAEQEPVQLRLGSRRMALLRSDMPVEKTSVRNCKGLYTLLCKPAWSIVLVLLMVGIFLYESYLNTILAKEPAFYLSSVMPYMMGLIALTLLVAGISRLSIQRWEIGAAASLAALFMVVPHLLGELGHFLNYLFTSDKPLDWLLLLSNFLTLPILLYAYTRLIHHTSVWPAVGVALLFSAPLLVYQATDLADRLAVSNEFTGEAKFNRTLSSWDIRLEPTISIDRYMQRVQTELAPPTHAIEPQKSP